MLFPLFSNAVTPAADSGATRAAIKCLLAYTHGLEDCQIDVEVVDGIMTLTGTAPSEEAARAASAIAADFMSGRVACSIQVLASSHSA
jgi:osmotically-inducible protein OsmY